MERIIWIYLFFVNIGTFLLFGVDKRKAIHGKWRIRERTLLGFAFIGGSLGAFLGMVIFRHKTRKALFQIGVPLMVFCHIGLAVYMICR